MIVTLCALAEPNRLRIIDLLRDGPRAVGEIVDRLRMRQPQASKHLRVLSKAGLVAVRPDAQRRIYELQSEPLRELDQWLANYRRMWEGQFGLLDTLLTELQGKEPEHGPGT